MRREEMIYGAWVRMRDDVSGTPAMVVSFEDEAVDLACAGDMYPAALGDLEPLWLDSAMLEGFGFRRAKGDNVWFVTSGDMRLTVALRMRHGREECRRCAISGKIACWNEEIRFVHELQRWWNERVLFPFDIPLNLEWHGRGV